jgi:hypothetical protein
MATAGTASLSSGLFLKISSNRFVSR